jgi:plastocyanin
LFVLSLATVSLWPASAAVAGGGCHSQPTQGSGDIVAMSKMCFGPSVLQVDPGTEVTFVNKDPIVHNVSAEWGTGQELNLGDSFSATFPEEGTYPYACTYHWGMTGAIVVGDGTGPGSGAQVESSTVVASTPLSQRADSVTSTSEQGSRVLGWAVAGGIGLLLGAGLSGLALRGLALRGRREI